jgi:hypothetical protein
MESLNVNPIQAYQPLSSTMSTWGLGAGLDGCADNGIYFGFTFFRHKYKQETNFIRTEANAYGRDFIHRNQNSMFLIDFGYRTETGLTLAASFGITNSNHWVEVWQVYADGSRSIGPELYTNGYYKATNSRLPLGAKVEFNVFKNIVRLNARVIYNWDFIKTITGENYSFTLEDPTEGKDPTFAYLPKDYVKFVQDINANNTAPFLNNENSIFTDQLLKLNVFASIVISIPFINE